MRGKKTKGGSAEGKRTKRESNGGRKTKEGSAGDRKTKRGSAGGRRTGILVIFSILVVVSILVYLLASFCFGYSLLTLFFPLQLPILFPKILFFIIVVLNCSNSFHDGTVIPVQTGRPCTESPIRVKLGIRGTVFSKPNWPNIHTKDQENWSGNHRGIFVAFQIQELLKVVSSLMAVVI